MIFRYNPPLDRFPSQSSPAASATTFFRAPRRTIPPATMHSLSSLLLTISSFSPLALAQQPYSFSDGSIPDVSSSLQNILRNTHRSDLYSYPTDFTRGIIPKPLHSHNDYWRDVPFYSALSWGAVSVEADVWLMNDTLYVSRISRCSTNKRSVCFDVSETFI